MKRKFVVVLLSILLINTLYGCGFYNERNTKTSIDHITPFPSKVSTPLATEDNQEKEIFKVVKYNLFTQQSVEIELTDVIFAQIIKDSNGEKYVMVYKKSDCHKLIKLSNFETISIPINRQYYPNNPRRIVGFIEEFYSNRIYKNNTYFVDSHEILYSYNLDSKQKREIYRTSGINTKAIYSVSLSPDGEKIAILVSSDIYIGPEADLIVFNKDGEKIFSCSNASCLSHSDGFLSVYPLDWESNNVVLSSSDSGKQGMVIKNHINIIENSCIYTEQPFEFPIAYVNNRISNLENDSITIYKKDSDIWTKNKENGKEYFVGEGTIFDVEGENLIYFKCKEYIDIIDSDIE